jgi:hypothetical protein
MRILCDIAPHTVNYSSQVYLLQHEKKINKKRTSTKRGERSPIFNEAMIFSVPAHTLQVSFLHLTGRFAIVSYWLDMIKVLNRLLYPSQYIYWR